MLSKRTITREEALLLAASRVSGDARPLRGAPGGLVHLRATVERQADAGSAHAVAPPAEEREVGAPGGVAAAAEAVKVGGRGGRGGQPPAAAALAAHAAADGRGRRVLRAEEREEEEDADPSRVPLHFTRCVARRHDSLVKRTVLEDCGIIAECDLPFCLLPHLARYIPACDWWANGGGLCAEFPPDE